MQLQQQLSQQQQELLQQLQLLHHQYLMHHGINLQQQFLSHKQKSHQLNGGKLNLISKKKKTKPFDCNYYATIRSLRDVCPNGMRMVYFNYLIFAIDLFQVDNALSLIKLGALDGLGNSCIENTSMHDLIYLSEFHYLYSFYPSVNGKLVTKILSLDDTQLNAKNSFNGTNMSKIEPIDDDQDYQDADIITSETANYKDDDDGGGDVGGGGGGGGGGSGHIPTENSNIDDTEREAIDSKPILGSLNNSSANIDEANKTNANDSGCQQRRNSNGNGNNLCNADANETNLNDSETNDRSDIDNKLAPATTSTQNGMQFYPIFRMLFICLDLLWLNLLS